MNKKLDTLETASMLLVICISLVLTNFAGHVLYDYYKSPAPTIVSDLARERGQGIQVMSAYIITHPDGTQEEMSCTITSDVDTCNTKWPLLHIQPGDVTELRTRIFKPGKFYYVGY